MKYLKSFKMLCEKLSTTNITYTNIADYIEKVLMKKNYIKNTIRGLNGGDTAIEYYIMENDLDLTYEEENNLNKDENFINYLMNKIEVRKDEVISEFENLLYHNKEKIKIYRAMEISYDYVNSLTEGDSLGIFWTYDIKGLDNFYRSPKTHIIIESEIDIDKIDWVTTIMLNMELSIGDDEREIRLYEGTPLNILAVTQYGKKVDISRIKNMVFEA